eukprot:CAMPEP_0194362864 /NCGR_PEP_ID=MMETSP0174-20130528/10712_1 /TAXON_ID=216777 /ORGANISM="Proboscia alata, Strain PI-D3" /LENGTH=469 /DNA_ID=CAMNT_0039136037 /DNA_START=227 /DNA_END=1636 /DNA_ORIENTATION=+
MRSNAHISRMSQTNHDQHEYDDDCNNDNDKAAEVPLQPLALILLSQFVLFIGVGAVIPTLPLYAKSIGLSSAANGIVLSAPALTLLILAKPSGRFSDNARKPALIGGLMLYAISDLGTALSSSIPPLLFTRLGLGAGICAKEAGERGMLADLVSQVPEIRGKVLAANQAMAALGIAVGAPLGGVVVELYGPRAVFLCASGAALITAFLYLFLPETVPAKRNGEDVSSDENLSLLAMNDNSVEWKELLTQPAWRGLVMCELGAKIGYIAKLSSIPVLAAQVLPGGAIGAGTLISAAGLSGLIGAPLGGWLIDRAGARFTALTSGLISGVSLMLIPLVLNYYPSSIAITSAVVSIDAVETASFSNTGAAFVTVVLIWSTAVAAQGPALTAIAQKLAPSGQEATSMALPRASGDALFLVAPSLLGSVADWASLQEKSLFGLECGVAGTFGLLGVLGFLLQSSNADKEEMKDY